MTIIKKALSAALLMGVAITSFADTPKTSHNAEHPYTQLCMAALISEEAFLEKARALNIGKAERDRLVCNDMTVEEFADTYRFTDENTIATVQ